MKSCAAWAIGAILVVVVFSVFFLNWGHAGHLPEYPDTVGTPGEYWIDKERFVEVRRRGDRFAYFECEIDNSDDPSGSGVVEYNMTEVESVELEKGWAIGLEAPDVIVIDTGSGETLRRTFQEAARSAGSPPPDLDEIRKVIAGEPQLIPIEEVSKGAEDDANRQEDRTPKAQK